MDYNGASGAIQNWYAFGPGPNAVLNQVNIAGSTRTTYVPDIQGSIVASLDASSGTLTKTGYQTYGESGTTAGTFRYTGARIDAETNGLYDFRARMYSPVLGRFLQVDPSGYRGGLNLYAYVNNDPLNHTDPLGLMPDSPQGQSNLYGGSLIGVSNILSTVPDPEGALALADVANQNPGAALAGAAVGAAGAAGLTLLPEAGTLLPGTLARVVPNGIPLTTLGPPGAADVFVTTPEAIEGLDATGIAQSLTIPESPSGFQVLQFPTPEQGLASQVFRTNPGFVGGGQTAGGAPEFVIPNGPIPPGATITTVP